MRRLSLTTQLGDVLRCRCLEDVWIDAAVSHYALLTVAVFHYTYGFFERVTESAAQRRA